MMKTVTLIIVYILLTCLLCACAGNSREVRTPSIGETQDPPTYSCVGKSDGIASWQIMKNRLDAMFALFIIHHVLNSKWCRNLFKGRYTPFRTVQTLLVALMLCRMFGSMVSGIVLSRHVFADLPIEGGSAWARTAHMICAYWGFVIMSLHLGAHWNMMMGMGKKLFRKPSKVHRWIARSIAFTNAAYGVYAFGVRQIGEYMLLKTPFVFFDFDEPLIFFFLDYLAVMGLFVCLGHYGSKLLILILN